MLTIADALQLPVFEQARLVAGHSGQGKPIRWVHIVSMPEREEPTWTKGSELILTVGFGLRANLERQQNIIAELKRWGIAGMVISVGHYLEATPQIMIDEANRLDFPIIELPGDVPFVEVTETIFTYIINDHYALQQRVQTMHHTLTEIVLDGGTLNDIVERLADFLDKSITIENASFELLAHAQRGSIDTARRRSVENRHTSQPVIDELVASGLYRQLLTMRQSVRIRANPKVGLEIERIVSPIIVARQIIGYIWILGGDEELTPLDEMAIGQAATIAALLMYKEQAVYETQMKVRGDFFDELLQAHEGISTRLKNQATIVDFRMNQQYQVLVVSSPLVSPFDTAQLARTIEEALEPMVKAFVVAREGQVMVVLQTHHRPEGRAIAQHLYEALGKDNGSEPMVIGVGMSAERLEMVAISYEQAQEALTIADAVGFGEPVVMFEDLGLLYWLRQIPKQTLAANTFYQVIERLAEDDHINNKKLLQTLETFLDTGGNIKDTAENLFVHRNTLIYRLERIQGAIGLDLRNTQNQLNLSVAIKTYKLHQSGIFRTR